MKTAKIVREPKDIADRLSVSTKTVENQMGRALKFLKEELGGFLSVFL